MSKVKETTIGQISVEVKAGLSVDEKTARICMDLLSIYFKNRGYKGVVMAFRDDSYDSDVMQVLTTEEAVDIAMMAPFSCNKGEKAENEEEE